MSDARYISRVKRAVRTEDEWWPESRERMDVIIVADDQVDTGLVDQHGNPLVRLSPRRPMGFCR